MPPGVTNTRFHYEVLLTNGAATAQWLPSAAGVFTNNPVTLTWTNTQDSNGLTNRMFMVRAWFDCEGSGVYDDTEPHRILYVNILKVEMVPDYNHDRKIDHADRARLSSNETYRFWVNDDHETSDAGGEGRK